MHNWYEMKPLRILVCILCTFAVLGVVCLLGAGKSSLVRIPTLASVLSLPQPMADSLLAKAKEVDTSAVVADTLTQAQTMAKNDSVPTRPRHTTLPQSLPQTKLYLPLFYQALSESGSQAVRVVHLGDSQIEEDRISMQLRYRLQERFGGGGVGLLPMVQTIPTFTVKQRIEQDGHPLPYTAVKRYLAYGPSAMRMKSGNRYGPMSQVACINEPIDVSLELLREKVPTYNYDRIRVLCSDSIHVALIPDSLERQRFVLQDPPTDSLGLQPTMRQVVIVLDTLRRNVLLRLSGEGDVYGLSLETATGLQVDNIPMRGAAGTHFTAVDIEPFAAYFRTTNTRLVIMQFGGNAMPSLSSRGAVERYTAAMRQQIQYLMSVAPDASLLFIGPADMITTIDGEQQSYPMLPYLDKCLAAMVEEENGAYYSLFRLMGGAGSMFHWRDVGLAGDDMIHFTRAGARKVGDLLAKQLLEDYDYVVESQKPKVESQDTTTQYLNDSINE